MSRWLVPLQITPDTYSIGGTVRLSGTDYVYRLIWNTRTARWVISLATQAGSEIIRGRTLTIYGDVLNRCTHAERPPGRLYVWAEDGQIRDFGHDELGTSVLLWYVVD